MTEDQQEQYKLKNSNFGSIIDELPLWSAPFGLKLLDTVSYKKGICALDIGCGFGFPLIELAMRLGPASKVYGVDPDKSNLERTGLKIKLMGLQNVEPVECIAEKMPFENNKFDLIVSNNGINNVHDLSKTLMECGRVSKDGAQLVFSYNTYETFLEFYRIFHEIVKENGLQEYEKEIDAHIYSKRKPLVDYEKALIVSGFRIRSIFNDRFSYKFTDGTSMLDHFTIKLLFLSAWKKIIPENQQEMIFKKIEEKLNMMAEENEGLTMTVPFVLLDCEKVKA